MSEKKIVVPDGMLLAAMHSDCMDEIENIDEEKQLEAALRWLSENPIVPTDEQYYALCEAQPNNLLRVVEWQRRMFENPIPATEIMECAKMQVAVELARKILNVLKHENTKDAINALKVAMIFLPVKVSSSSALWIDDTDEPNPPPMPR